MIYFTIDTDGLDRLSLDLDEWDHRARDLMPLAERVAYRLYEQNLEARSMGLDRDGHPFAPLSPATFEIHENIYGVPRGDGPPLAPMYGASRVIAGFEVDVQRHDLTSVDVVGSWPSMEDFLGYHITGTRKMPARNPVGVTPRGWAAISDEFDLWLDTLARG